MLPYSVSSRSILITSILNSACDRLAIFFCLVLFLVFCSFLSFGLCFFVSSIWQPPCVCFCVLGRAALTPCLSVPIKLYGGRALGICQGEATHFTTSCGCCRGDSAAAWLLEACLAITPFQSLYPLLICDWHPPAVALVLNPRLVGFVYILRPCRPFKHSFPKI